MLEVKWKVPTYFPPAAFGLVSILVMLEVKWKDFQGLHPLRLYFSFNPCYVGSKMERSSARLEAAIILYVSILVMLEVKWKGKESIQMSPYIAVSILVMLEVKWKEKAIKQHCISINVSILVMLEVKWKVAQLDRCSGIILRFNPCYVGSKMERN